MDYLYLPIAMTVGCGVLAILYHFFFLNIFDSKCHIAAQQKSSTKGNQGMIPFLYFPSGSDPPSSSTSSSAVPSIDKIIQASLQQFRKEASQSMQGLSMALERVQTLEDRHSISAHADLDHVYKISTTILLRIEHLSRCLEEQEQLLSTLLYDKDKSFLMLTLPSTTSSSSSSSSKTTTPVFQKTTRIPRSFSRSGPTFNENTDSGTNQAISHSYDAAGQIIAHLVRDWTILGQPVRASLYDWCIHQLEQYYPIPSMPLSSLPILVPGAGMGRLAYGISQQGYTVEANEVSPVMAAAAHAILQKKIQGHVYPYLLDRMSDEWDVMSRFQLTTFPDTNISPCNDGVDRLKQDPSSSSLSFTVGDFVSEYYYHSTLRQGSYGAIVTCYFLDTATNIYEYLDVIGSLLSPNDGVWVNVGPLHWHVNAMVFPSVEELKGLIQSRRPYNHRHRQAEGRFLSGSYSFEILEWSMDCEPLAYRDNGYEDDEKPHTRSTRFEGFRPLRFVAVKRHHP